MDIIKCINVVSEPLGLTANLGLYFPLSAIQQQAVNQQKPTQTSHSSGFLSHPINLVLVQNGLILLPFGHILVTNAIG